METQDKFRLADVFVSISDPRQPGKMEHQLVELLIVAVNAVLVGSGTFVEIELWAKENWTGCVVIFVWSAAFLRMAPSDAYLA